MARTRGSPGFFAFWKSTAASARDRPFSASVIIEADAVEIAHPDP